MIKVAITLGKISFISALLLFGIVFLQSCTKKMPILKPLSSKVPSNYPTESIITLTLDNGVVNTLTSIKPASTFYKITLGGTSAPLYREYFIVGNNGLQINHLIYSLTFHTDVVGSNKYDYNGSQVIYNDKTYTSVIWKGIKKLTVDKVNDEKRTISGSFAYYVYDDIYNPKDSIFVNGTFNIIK